jgi:hypothetical protein
MKRLDFKQMLIGLDQLMMHGKIDNQEQTVLQADAIDEYLKQTGWDWDSVLQEMCYEQNEKDNHELVN